MKVHLKSDKWQDLKVPVLIIPIFSDKRSWPKSLNFLKKHIHPKVDTLLNNTHLEWKLNQKLIAYTSYKEIPLMVLVGAGKCGEWDLEKARQLWGYCVGVVNELKERRMGIFWDEQFPQPADSEAFYVEVISALHTAAYRVTHFLTERGELPPEIEQVDIVHPNPQKLMEEWLVKGEQLGKAVNMARQLSEFPSNELTPEIFIRRIKQLGEFHGWQLKILDHKALEKNKLNALLAVAQGSDHLPYLSIASYKNSVASQTIGLVGKGVTFDTGGISIKPYKNMEEMKYDMSGAAAVLGALTVVSLTRLPVNVVATMPLVENMPSGRATRPGDVVTSYNGKTIEIINTDAEGRLILADALSYLERNYQLDYIVDLATLTGAVVVALGHITAAVFSANAQLSKTLQEAGEVAGERLWALPLWEDYKDLIKSKIADVRNVSTKSGAGAITAAIFLQNFISKTPWAHIDMAGTAHGMPEKSYRPEGATGFGVRLLWHWLNRMVM